MFCYVMIEPGQSYGYQPKIWKCACWFGLHRRWVHDGQRVSYSGAVGRKCAALTAKAFPPRTPGIPAAGLAKGTVQDERAYFNKCVANGGRVK
jgi:hypothetical protein